MTKRPVEILILSDIHLGTYGCHAKELLNYLKSVKPEMIILNGDIIDIWQFSKKYFPESHMKVLRKIMKFVSSGTPVYYLTGNHDELLRKFADFEMGSLQLKNKLLMNIDGKQAWIFLSYINRSLINTKVYKSRLVFGGARFGHGLISRKGFGATKLITPLLFF